MASVTLSWNAAPAADNVTSYQVWGANGTSIAFGSCALLATVAGLTWTNTGLPNAQARTYYIVAVNAIGSSLPDGPINITTAAASSTYVQNLGGAPSLKEGTHAARPAAGNAGAIYIEIDTFSIFRDNSVTWDVIGSGVGVASFNGRTGVVTLFSTDVTGALGYVPLSGNQTITLSGDVTGSGTTAITVTIGAHKVTRGMLAATAGAAILGTTAAGDVSDLTGAQATGLLSVFTSLAQGVVPPSGGGTTNFLRADNFWAVPPGSNSWIPLSSGAEPLAFISDGAGSPLLVAGP